MSGNSVFELSRPVPSGQISGDKRKYERSDCFVARSVYPRPLLWDSGAHPPPRAINFLPESLEGRYSGKREVRTLLGWSAQVTQTNTGFSAQPQFCPR